MRVFVTGASGVIGEAVAVALRRAGHSVFGLVRSADKANALLNQEVTAVVGDLLRPETYRDAAASCDAIVHTAVDYARWEQVDGTALETLLSTSTAEHPKLIVYTSGGLVYPHSATAVQEESGPVEVTGPISKRPIHERRVLNAEHAAGVVVRPAFVVGGRSPHFVEYFAQAKQGRVLVKGDPAITWSQVHIDDLAALYVAIVDSPPALVRGHIFNAADDSRTSNMDIARRFAALAGFAGAIEHDAEALPPHFRKSVLMSSDKARRMLKWRPAHRLMLDEAELYYAVWQARAALGVAVSGH